MLKLIIIVYAAGLTGLAAAEDAQKTARPPVVVELFTSQSCGSCVSAAAYFRELAGRDDIIALGWHVDYWNLLNTKHGRWTDPYSSQEHTERQRRYNINIRNRSSVYTPQIIVAGVGQAVGSSRDKISKLIEDERLKQPRVLIAANRKDNTVYFDVGRSQSGGNAYLVTFKRSVKTKVASGENAGVDFYDANAVTEVKRLGVIRRTGARLAAQPPGEGDGCALLVQEPGQGRIVAASYCPTQ